MGIYVILDKREKQGTGVLDFKTENERLTSSKRVPNKFLLGNSENSGTMECVGRVSLIGGFISRV